jgi:hypothetical protein
MWGDLATDTPVPESDEGYLSLIQLVPEDRREMASSMLRGLLANVKAQLTPENYRTYCSHLRAAWEAHSRGDAATARLILDSYGLPYDLIVARMG